LVRVGARVVALGAEERLHRENESACPDSRERPPPVALFLFRTTCILRARERAGAPRCKRVAMKVAVIGGGIGGLSAALQFLKTGLDVHVYEQAPHVAEIGAGIQISPNASRLLHRL